jgi:hypothetical protein
MVTVCTVWQTQAYLDDLWCLFSHHMHPQQLASTRLAQQVHNTASTMTTVTTHNLQQQQQQKKKLPNNKQQPRPMLTWMISGASSPTMCSPSSLPAPGSHSIIATQHPASTSVTTITSQQQQL